MVPVYCFWLRFMLDILNILQFQCEIFFTKIRSFVKNFILVFERANLHYYAVNSTLLENGLKTTILLFIAIIVGTIHRSAKLIMTRL